MENLTLEELQRQREMFGDRLKYVAHNKRAEYKQKSIPQKLWVCTYYNCLYAWYYCTYNLSSHSMEQYDQYLFLREFI